MSTLQKRRMNCITCLRDSVGNWLNEYHLIKDHILDFYTYPYSTDLTTSNWSHTLASFCFVPQYIGPTLSSPLDHKEVIDAIFFFKPLKAPDPDGLHFFYQ